MKWKKLNRIAAIIAALLSVSLAVYYFGFRKRGQEAVLPAAAPGIVQTQPQIVKELYIPEDDRITAYLPISDMDRKSLPDRYRLPELSRMAAEERAELVDTRQSVRRIETLELDVTGFQFPEANYKRIYNTVRTDLDQGTAFEETAEFSGSRASELNVFLAENNGKTVSVTSREIISDEVLNIPSDTVLLGNGVRIVPGENAPDRAILLDRVSNVRISDITLDGGFLYGIYVKYSDHFCLEKNQVSGMGIKGIVLMGDNQYFRLADNNVQANGDGGVYIDGDAAEGILENNRITDNLGAGNLGAGLVLCALDIKDENTAWNPWEDLYIYDITKAPHHLVIFNNDISGNRSSGCYSHAGFCNYILQNRIIRNEKEGMCLDYGSDGNYVAYNLIRANGGRYRMSDEDLERDFIGGHGRLPDGSSPAKLPGISLDNSAYNTIYNNLVIENYGSGIKAVRSAYRNILLCNEITDNNQGVSETFHFFGVELATDMNADEEVKGLDFSPCFENIIARNTISGAHYSGIYYGIDAYVNDSFDNVIMGPTHFAVECHSEKFNSVVNNPADIGNLGV